MDRTFRRCRKLPGDLGCRDGGRLACSLDPGIAVGFSRRFACINEVRALARRSFGLKPTAMPKNQKQAGSDPA
ncbi:MAG: hypothetical protein KF881_02305, partial [Acidobacteria bacterium]|nr:hypothetical protein [Acidobacteriota bacterium]